MGGGRRRVEVYSIQHSLKTWQRETYEKLTCRLL